MNEQNEDEVDVNEEHVDCSDAFNTTQVLKWFIVIKLIKLMSLWRLNFCGLHCKCCGGYYEVRHKHWYERKNFICLNWLWKEWSV